ncbi:conserved Plasmodium protein, unknown function [Plasmodium gallinaceum]|uniref:Uncharacterized protein n=1 Tax=Plasmodium gallinaceum TaxID=5849 RepID=A0A1J1GRV3_PLAGA|nr:conserved Plasmodium protein, unknown function [Plasmodium gallinaceum]CRG94032.1 conserved Plasmodium protein, unknown function [Plasmodium gallinaceum]
MNGFKVRTNSQKFRYFNNRKLNNNIVDKKYKNKYNNVDEISEYLINISYILNEKYEKYFAFELREENLKKGNKLFNRINLEFSFDLEDDICILIKILDEIKGNEIELINQRKCSKIMEKIIFYCFFLLKYNEKNVKNKDISIQCLEVYNHFFKIILNNFINLALSDYASHFLQTIICVFSFFNKYEDIYIEEINKKNGNYNNISSYFIEICNIIGENLFSLIFDKCGTHVLRSFLYSLGGYLNINISNITFRKSKARKSNSKNELKYIDKSYDNSIFYDYIYKIIEKITEEIVNPKESLIYKNLLYQYIYYDNQKEKEQNGEKYIIESSNQYFICPLLYNTYSVPTLATLFEILKDKNIECDKLICEFFLIEKTKKYYIDKTDENIKCYDESPLKQLLDILIKLDNASIMIEKLLKINNEHIFYVFNVYIIKNINNLICDNIYSNIVLHNYLNFEYITEEMFELLMKNIDIEKIIKNKKYNILKCLFDLSQCYKTNCKFLFNSLIKNLNLDFNNNNKFMWISILCMCNYNELNPLIIDVFNKKENETFNENHVKDNDCDILKNDSSFNNSDKYLNLNNYNFYNYIKIDINGYYILSYILSFPKESYIPLINSFKHFCNFLKNVSENKPNETDIDNYNKFCETFLHKNEPDNNIDNFENTKSSKEVNMNYEKLNNNSQNNNNQNNYNINNNNFNDKHNIHNQKKIKPFLRKNAELRGNILLYFSCDKNLSILCEKIAQTFNLINEKYLRTFILLFKDEYKNIASHYIGAHTIVTFFKLGTNDIKKRILDELIENDLNIYNNYIKNFMKLKEYKKTKTINTNNKKYLKAKKLFEDILISKEKKGIENNQIEKKENKENNNESIDMNTEYIDENSNSESKLINNLKVKKSKKENNFDYFNSEKSVENNVNAEIMGDSNYPKLLDKKKKKDKEKKKKKKKEKVNESKDNSKDDIYKEQIINIKDKDNDNDNDYLNNSCVTLKNKNNDNKRMKNIDEDKEFMNVISDFIQNSKKKKRKRKKEKEKIEEVLKKKKM